MQIEQYMYMTGCGLDPIDILAQAAQDTNSPGAWRSIMNAIWYLRTGRNSNMRQPGISHDICTM